MPVTYDSSGLRSGFNCAIGVLAGTNVGDVMVRDCAHIVRRGRVMRCCDGQLLRLQLEWWKVQNSGELTEWARGNADANKESCSFLVHYSTFWMINTQLQILMHNIYTEYRELHVLFVQYYYLGNAYF